MKKNRYNQPSLYIVELTESDAIMLTMSDKKADSTAEVEVKSDISSSPNNYSVWDDDWSR